MRSTTTQQTSSDMPTMPTTTNFYLTENNKPMKDLLDIIQKLKAPKDLNNTFGNYKYRSCESILEAVKPLLAEKGCVLNLSDRVESIGNANYVRATATFVSSSGEKMFSDGYAREDINKKGMDAPQMTGTASSYARKYALNGLFCIDDTKDADTDEYSKENTKRAGQGAPETTPQRPTITKNSLSSAENRTKMYHKLQDLSKCSTAIDFSPIIALKEQGYEIEEGAGEVINDIWYNK